MIERPFFYLRTRLDAMPRGQRVNDAAEAHGALAGRIHLLVSGPRRALRAGGVR